MILITFKKDLAESVAKKPGHKLVIINRSKDKVLYGVKRCIDVVISSGRVSGN